MDLLPIFETYVMMFAMAFLIMPLFLVSDWKKRGTSDGFSSAGFSMVTVMVAMWLRYGMLTEDPMNTYVNMLAVIIFGIVLSAFAFYQSDRSNIRNQAVIGSMFYVSVLFYCSQQPSKAEEIASLGFITTVFQNFSLVGTLYDMYRAVFELKTTEYMNAQMVMGGTIMAMNFFTMGYLRGDAYMMYSNVGGLICNSLIFILYAAYPPLTWVVPILGVGGKQKTN